MLVSDVLVERERERERERENGKERGGGVVEGREGVRSVRKDRVRKREGQIRVT